MKPVSSSVRAAFGLAAVLLSTGARADAEGGKRAERLFKEGADALEHGRYDEACSKLKESSTLARALGTEYNLGVCYEVTHKPASAKAAFLRAAEIAKQNGKDGIAKDATARAKKVEALVPRLVLHVPAGVPAATVVCDDLPLTAKQLEPGTIELDPGPHRVRASAPGRTPFEAKVDLVEARTTEITILLPLLSEPPKPAPPPAPTQRSEPEAEPSPLWKPIAIGVVGLGAVGLGVGGFLGLSAKGKSDESGCRDGRVCPDVAASKKLEDAKAQADLATLFVVGGSVLVVGGAMLYVLAPSTAPKRATFGARPSVRVVPAIAGDATGVAVFGAF